MAKISKRMKAVYEGLDRNKQYALEEAVGILTKAKKVNFDESIEISLNLGIDPRHAD